MNQTPHEAGKSSFDLIDREAFFAALPLEGVRLVLDLGCGAGNYAIPIAKRLGMGGRVAGFDLWADGIKAMLEAAEREGLENVSGHVSNVNDLSAVESREADLVLMATVIHDLAERGDAQASLNEAARVLRPGGILAAVEFKKIDSKPGPPLHIRLSPEELTALVSPHGFTGPGLAGLGPSLYLAIYKKT